jgi:TIR domain
VADRSAAGSAPLDCEIMQIFLSYPSEERALAERVRFALGAAGHEVFFDREDLPPGDEFDQSIRRAMQASALLVFLITPAAVAHGRYTLTELKLAEERWPRPSGRVLPVMLHTTPIDSIPAYLKAVSILEPVGDVVAEIAWQAERLLTARSLRRRARAWLTSPVGIASVLLVAALGAATWRFGPRIAESAAARLSAMHGFGLDPAVRNRARFVAATDEGYAVITSGPAQVVRFNTRNQRLGEPISLPGEPIALRQTPKHLLVATGTPPAIAIVSTELWSVVDTLPLEPAGVDAEPGTRVSGEIVSLVVVGGVPWVVTGGSDGAAAVLRLRPTGEWVVATWAMSVPPGPFEFSARGLHLETIGPELWGVTTDTTPASLYRIMGTVRVDRISGDDVPMIRCAHDLAESAGGNMLLLSCDRELQEIRAEGLDLTLVRKRQTLPSEDAPGNRTWERIVSDGHTVFVALNSQTNPPANRPVHARIARVDDSGSTQIFDEASVAVTSMAVTPRAVLVALRRADGSLDSRRIARQP